MKRLMAALVIAATLFCSVPVLAEDASDTVTQTYEIDVKDGQSVEKSDVFEEEKQTDNGKLILNDVEYKVVKEEPVYRDAVLKESVTEVTDQKDYKADESITKDGVTYKLKETKLQKTTTVQEANLQSITKSFDYENYMTASDVPASVNVETVDEVTGETVNVECMLESFTETDGGIVSVPIVYTNYDSDYYIYKGGEVQRDDISPALSAYEAEILADAGLDGRNARITSITWNGDPYTDENGDLARNATANVSVTHYRATYSGSINTPESLEYTFVSTYEGEGEQEVAGVKHVTVEATATYKAETAAIPVAVIVGIAVVILAILIILILFVLAKRRKKNEEDKKKI